MSLYSCTLPTEVDTESVTEMSDDEGGCAGCRYTTLRLKTLCATDFVRSAPYLTVYLKIRGTGFHPGRMLVQRGTLPAAAFL